MATRQRLIWVLPLVLILAIAAGCSPEKSKPSSPADAALTGEYAVVDLRSGAVKNLNSAPSDLLSNNAYKTTKLVLKRIAAGTFDMGDEDGDGSSRERPVHSVRISEPYYIGVFELTQGQWSAAMGSQPSQFSAIGETRPVESISWNDICGAVGLTTTLSQLTGLGFDLPTEAQWEYACKAGEHSENCGCYLDLLHLYDAKMWYSANANAETHPVGQKQPNAFGLYDTRGNVWEWCKDRYSTPSDSEPSYYALCEQAGTAIDPSGSATGADRIVRGGGWGNGATYCRASSRSWRAPNSQAASVGARLVAVQKRAPQILSSASETAVVGQLYSYALNVSGSPTPDIRVTGLPSWLTYNPINRTISGTPLPVDVGRTGTITVMASNGIAPDAVQTFEIDVRQSPAITSTAQMTAYVGYPYSYSIIAMGDPLPLLSVSNLPAWLTFDGDDTISGTPAAENIGLSETITFTATNGIEPDAVQTFNIVVSVPVAPAITSIAPTTATVGTVYSFTITATGNPAPSLSVTDLPVWLSFDGLDTISGTPNVDNIGETDSITVTAMNGIEPDAVQTFSIDVHISPMITSTAPAAATVGTMYSYTITATGNPTPTLSVTSLPSWLSYNSGTQTISGTPDVDDIGETETITVTATNEIEPDAVQAYSIVVWELYGLYVVVDLQSPYSITNLSSSPADLHTNDAYKTTKLVLKRIPAGTFQMGDQTGAGYASRELPVHPVSITKDFYIGVFKVTQRQWFEVMGNWPSYYTTDPDQRPVERVSWNDINGGSGFLDVLSGLIGESFDLPTEAEWEYSCKAGTSTNYSYGGTGGPPDFGQDGAYMWYYENNGVSGTPEYGTKEVGTRFPNPWGLYDMHGNVYEWCLDWYSSTSTNPPSYYQTCYDLGTVSDPMGPTTGSFRVVRGGGWNDYAAYCRAAYRFRELPVLRAYALGLRVVAVRRD